MHFDRWRDDDTLAKALEVAITAKALPEPARSWGKTVLLEELASVLGLPRHTLRNLYYRHDPRLHIVLQSYVASSSDQVARGLQDLQFHGFAPVVWKRTMQQMKESRRSLPAALALARSAAQTLRGMTDPPVELRRSVGTVAAEVMACALTFFDGPQRWQLLSEGDRLFLLAMSPLAFASEVEACDAALFARFWENRATRCGLEWSNIWDDPDAPPTVAMDVVRLAIDELEHAARWMRQHAGRAGQVNESERLRQLLADKAKWLAKAGRFARAERELTRLGDFSSAPALVDALLVRTLALIVGNQLELAARSSAELSELVADQACADSLARATSSMMVHNVELLRGRRPQLSDRIQQFFEASPVAGSEMINLPRYKERLTVLGYSLPAAILRR